MVQKSDALFVMNASEWVDELLPVATGNEHEHGRASERDSCLQAHSTLLMIEDDTTVAERYRKSRRSSDTLL